jgi:hypothetical protein
VNNLKSTGFLFLLAALISLLIAVYMILENQMLGFPDGHLTDLDNALCVFYKIAIPVSILFLISFLLMSFSTFLKRKIRIIILYCFAATIFIGISVVCYFIKTLDNGIGG